MIRVALLAAVLAACTPTSGAATAPPLTEETMVDTPTPTATPNGCDVEVSFGSFAAGPDAALMQRVQAAVEAEPGVTGSESRSWGREGESTLCIHTADTAAADRLFTAIAAMIPDRSPVAPTTVTHRDGRERNAGWQAGRN